MWLYYRENKEHPIVGQGDEIRKGLQMEEYKKENMPCVNLAGIYDKVGDKWRESVNAPNPLFTYIKVDGVKFALPEKLLGGLGGLAVIMIGFKVLIEHSIN